MKKIVFYLIILNIIYPLVNSSTSCSIFPSLNCSCFQSNLDLNSSLPIKTYSHLHCHGKSLNKKTFQSPFGSDFIHQNRFRTISIEFFLENHVEIQPNQFDPLSILFIQTNTDALIEIFIRFNGFNHITLNKQSFTSNMFQRKHQNKHLSLHFIPSTLNYIQVNQSFSRFFFQKIIIFRMNLMKIVQLISKINLHFL
jgi:hypothetical protein